MQGQSLEIFCLSFFLHQTASRTNVHTLGFTRQFPFIFFIIILKSNRTQVLWQKWCLLAFLIGSFLLIFEPRSDLALPFHWYLHLGLLPFGLAIYIFCYEKDCGSLIGKKKLDNGLKINKNYPSHNVNRHAFGIYIVTYPRVPLLGKSNLVRLSP